MLKLNKRASLEEEKRLIAPGIDQMVPSTWSDTATEGLFWVERYIQRRNDTLWINESFKQIRKK